MPQAIREVGQALYREFGWSAAAPERPGAAEPSTMRADKLRRKQEVADRLPVRSMAATGDAPAEPVTASAIIAEMRAGRPGQAA